MKNLVAVCIKQAQKDKDYRVEYPTLRSAGSIKSMAGGIRLAINETRHEWSLVNDDNRMLQLYPIGFDREGPSRYKIEDEGDEFFWCIMDLSDLDSVDKLIGWITELAEKNGERKPPVGLDC